MRKHIVMLQAVPESWGDGSSGSGELKELQKKENGGCIKSWNRRHCLCSVRRSGDTRLLRTPECNECSVEGVKVSHKAGHLGFALLFGEECRDRKQCLYNALRLGTPSDRSMHLNQ